MTINEEGALAFGLVIGWVTYRTLRRSEKSGLSDIATVIGAVGGAAITKLFPSDTATFGMYCIGLAIGFFAYFIVSLILASKADQSAAVNEWLGEPPKAASTSGGGGGGGSTGGNGGVPDLG